MHMPARRKVRHEIKTLLHPFPLGKNLDLSTWKPKFCIKSDDSLVRRSGTREGRNSVCLNMSVRSFQNKITNVTPLSALCKAVY